MGLLALRLAIFEKNVEIFYYLREKQNLNSKLFLTNNGDKVNILDELIKDKKFNLNEKDKVGNTVLHHVALNGNLETVKILVEKYEFDLNAINYRGDSIMHNCAKRGNFDLARYLTSKKNISLNLINEKKATPLLMAGKLQHWDIAELLINKNVDIRQVNGQGNSVLHFASRDNEIELVKLFLKRQIDVNILNKKNFSPLSFASRNGYLQLVELLIENGANFEKRDKFNFFILDSATYSKSLETVKYLVEQKNMNVNSPENTTSALHLAAKNNQLNLVKYLLEKNANIDAIDDEGNTALLLACEEKNWKTIKLLIERKANSKLLNKKGNSIFHEIAKSDNLEILNFLKSKSITLDKNMKNNQGYTLIHFSVLNNRIEMTKYLVEKERLDFNQESNDKKTPLLLATDLECARYLIESKVVSHNENLFFNAENNYLGILKYLIQIRKFDANAEDNYGKSILMVAVENGHFDMIKYLVNEIKMDLNKLDMYNKSASDYVEKHVKIARFLDEMNNSQKIRRFNISFDFPKTKKPLRFRRNSFINKRDMNLHLIELDNTIDQTTLIDSTSTQKYSTNLKSQNELNSTLILLNVFVRKFLTQEKFISSGSEQLSELDTKMRALNILNEFEQLLDETSKKLKVSFDFDPTPLISKIEWLLRNEKMNEISKLLTSVYVKYFPEFEQKYYV